LIVGRDIENTKVMIGVGQFHDPFNLYDEGIWDIGSIANKNS
jgi:hypothetical protein